MRWFLVLLAACAAPPLQREPAPQPLVMQQPDLGTRWETTEGIWRGTWVRRPHTDTFDATWSSDQYGTFHGTLTIRVDDGVVDIDRRDLEREWANSDSRCAYRAKLTDDTVHGSTWCEIRGQVVTPLYAWSAQIH